MDVNAQLLDAYWGASVDALPGIMRGLKAQGHAAGHLYAFFRHQAAKASHDALDQAVKRLEPLADGDWPPLLGMLVANCAAVRSPQTGDSPKRIQDLRARLEPRLPPDLARSLARSLAIRQAHHRQQNGAYEKGMLDVLQNEPPTSGPWIRTAFHWRWYLALRGRGLEFAPVAAPLPDKPHIQDELAIIRFIDAVEAGRIDEARALVETTHAASGILSGLQHLVLWYEGVLLVMEAVLAGRRPGSAIVEIMVSGLPRGSEGPQQIADLVDLAQGGMGRPAPDGDVLNASAMVAFHPLRIALVRNPTLAGPMLRRRTTQGAVSWLDALFRARLLLSGEDESSARDAYAMAARGAERYGAQARLEFELRLAHDLSRSDLVRLGSGATLTPNVVRPAVDPGTSAIIGPSPQAARLRALVRTLADSPLPVLVVGPTGSGKELVARALHEASQRRSQPLIAVNCSAITDSLLESELFGHVRGAFSGAEIDRPGLVAAAGAGTLFLDEIGDASPRFQAALLRLLDHGEYRPVGAVAVRIAPCRIVAATNIELAAAVEEGRFRRDLYHRLRRHSIRVPPLSARTEDVLPLALHFLAQAAMGSVRTISRDLAEALRARAWPGHIRELRNLLEHLAVIHASSTCLTADHLAEVDADDGASAVAAVPTPISAQPAIPAAMTPAGSGRSIMRQREQALALFITHRRLTRREFATLLQVSPNTATAYLKHLCQDGRVRKVSPSGAPLSQYFEVV